MTTVQAAPGRVIVIGAGLAGLAAACTLADSGLSVTVLEARRRPGGATFSFRRYGPAGVLQVDNGQHVVLRCYHRYRALLARFGTERFLPFQPRLRIPVLGRDGRIHTLQRARLPAPAQMAVGLAGFRALRPAERLAAIRAAAALARLDPADPELDQLSLGHWLTRQRQSPNVRQALWDLISVAALNAVPEQASLALAAMVLRTAFVTSGSAGADLGVPDRPLDELHVQPAVQYLAARGGRVLTGRRVRAVGRRDGLWTVRCDRPRAGAAPGPGAGADPDAGPDAELTADAVVLAAPAHRTAQLLPDGAGPSPADLGELGSAPIVSLHLVLDRRVLADRFLALPGAPAPWLFARPHPASDGGPADGGPADISPADISPAGSGQYLTMPISAGQEWLDLPAPEIVDRLLPMLRRLLPAARAATVLDSFVTRERHATFCQRPGTARLRPPSRTRLPGLALAGAWTATGWPDTIEGAVRSGEAAAAVIAEQMTGHRPATGRSAPAEPDPDHLLATGGTA